MDGTQTDLSPGTALGDLARDLRRSRGYIDVRTLVDDETPPDWKVVALSVVHLAKYGDQVQNGQTTAGQGKEQNRPETSPGAVQDVLGTFFQRSLVLGP